MARPNGVPDWSERVIVNGQERWLLKRDFFVYQLVFSAFNAQTGTLTKNIPVQADSDFRLEKLCYFADDNATAKVTVTTAIIPNVTVTILDTGSGRQIMDGAVALHTFFGTAENPFILPQPKIFAARSNIAVTLTGTEPAAATENIRLSFIGTKLFYA